jgi:hypothetical protein
VHVFLAQLHLRSLIRRHHGHLYCFVRRLFISQNLRRHTIQEQAAGKIQSELLFALESARMRFSVAMAMEAKSTPRERWEYYLETTNQMGRFIKKLRNTDFELQRNPPGWGRAMELLCNLPIQGRASRLCTILRDIVTELE